MLMYPADSANSVNSVMQTGAQGRARPSRPGRHSQMQYRSRFRPKPASRLGRNADITDRCSASIAATRRASRRRDVRRRYYAACIAATGPPLQL